MGERSEGGKKVARSDSALDALLPLREAERQLLAGFRRGSTTWLGSQCPTQASAGNSIRAELIRLLALGGSEELGDHPRGVELNGAWIEGTLDLKGASVAHRLILRACAIEEIIAREASFRTLDLGGSRLLRRLSAEACRCEGWIRLGDGFRVEGGVQLNDATIGGLDCHGALLACPTGISLDCAGMTVKGNVLLNHGFRAIGSVDFGKARIDGDLNCFKGRIRTPGKDAIYLREARIGGSVRLSSGFIAVGRVALAGATIAGDLDCNSAAFFGAGKAAIDCSRARIGGSAYLDLGFRAKGGVSFYRSSIEGDLSVLEARLENADGDALDCSEALIKGTFTFRKLKLLTGGIRLLSAQVGTLRDDGQSWRCARHHYLLDGFTYAALGGGAATDAAARIGWLRGQQGEDDPKSHFEPQPWDQLIAVLRAMGHPNQARTVAIAKHRRARDAGRYYGNAKLLDRLYGGLLGYGYRPSRLLIGLASIWLAYAGLYELAAQPELVGADTHLLAPAKSVEDPACLAARTIPGEHPCPNQPARYDDFNALFYSADVLLPVLSLGYKDEWQPVVRDAGGAPLPLGRALRILRWLEIALGWLAGLQLVALLGNLVKKD